MNRLGDLERAIMEVLWQTEVPLTVREVSSGLSQRNLAHTTVMTVLDRLAKKGFARRERDGRAWRYRPAETREAYVAELMLTALEQTGDRDAALARFAHSVSGAEAVVLREALAEFDRSRDTVISRNTGIPGNTGIPRSRDTMISADTVTSADTVPQPEIEGDTGVQLWVTWPTQRCSPWSLSDACEVLVHCSAPDGPGALQPPRFCSGSRWASAAAWRS